MTRKTPNSNSVNQSPLSRDPREASPRGRCSHHTRNGRCRMPVADSSATLCAHHARLHQKNAPAADIRPPGSRPGRTPGKGGADILQHADTSSGADILSVSAELTAGLSEFKSALPINDFLSRLLLFQAQGRIPPRHAAVMAYTCSLLLRSLPAMEHEAHELHPPSDQPTPIILVHHIPRPEERPVPESPADEDFHQAS